MDIALQCDGKVVAVGAINGEVWSWDAGVIRFNSDGKVVAVGFVDYGVDDTQVMVPRAMGDSTLIFASAFECGNTSAWTSSTP